MLLSEDDVEPGWLWLSLWSLAFKGSLMGKGMQRVDKFGPDCELLWLAISSAWLHCLHHLIPSSH